MPHRTITSIITTFLLVMAWMSHTHGQFSKAIEDNSFFIEEAYNQEPGIVQHISNGMFFRKPQHEFEFSLTQEWPLFGQKHQISYRLPYSFLNSNSVGGLGDLAINYRYQLQTGEEWAAISPRLTIIVPIGNEERGLGRGVLSWEFNLPLSTRLSEQFVGHANAGITLLPGVREKTIQGSEVSRTLASYFAGASIIWLARSNFNVMLEYLVSIDAEFDPNGNILRSAVHFIVPGFRYAIDIADLQIVPGLALPVVLAKDQTRIGVFFYLSFEHPF